MAKSKADRKITSASEWKKASGGQDVTVPSGQTCRARRVDLKTLIKTGKVPNALKKFIDMDAGGMKVDANDISQMILEDTKMMEEMFELVDTIVVACVIEPRVHPVPPDDEDRDDDRIYVDDIGDEDKMFLFEWTLGGLTKWETFRQEQSADVVGVSDGEGGTRSTE